MKKLLYSNVIGIPMKQKVIGMRPSSINYRQRTMRKIGVSIWKSIGILCGLCFTTITLANQLFYDQMSISTPTWEELDLTYINTINGKKYTEHANLLRPASWIKHNHVDKVGTTIHLTKEQLGIDTDVKVIAIKPGTLNYSNNCHENVKPLIATFITHSNNVWDYIFKDQYGHEKVMSAVASHLFYSADRQAFIPIEQFRIGEHVYGNKSILKGKHKHNKRVESIYNFEVYQEHNYIVESNRILVHNPLSRLCCCGRGIPHEEDHPQIPLQNMSIPVPQEAIIEQIPLITADSFGEIKNLGRFDGVEKFIDEFFRSYYTNIREEADEYTIDKLKLRAKRLIFHAKVIDYATVDEPHLRGMVSLFYTQPTYPSGARGIIARFDFPPGSTIEKKIDHFLSTEDGSKFINSEYIKAYPFIQLSNKISSANYFRGDISLFLEPTGHTSGTISPEEVDRRLKQMGF